MAAVAAGCCRRSSMELARIVVRRRGASSPSQAAPALTPRREPRRYHRQRLCLLVSLAVVALTFQPWRTEGTVGNYLPVAMQKTGARNRVEAAHIAE